MFQWKQGKICDTELQATLGQTDHSQGRKLADFTLEEISKQQSEEMYL